MTVGELLRRIDSRELTEWQVYDSIEPFSQYRQDVNAAMVASTVANYSLNKPKHKRFKIEDFLVRFKGAEAPAEAEASPNIADRLQSVFGGKIKRGDS